MMKWNYDFKRSNPLPVQDPFSVIWISIKERGSTLETTEIKHYYMDSQKAKDMTSIEDISILYDVSLSGILSGPFI